MQDVFNAVVYREKCGGYSVIFPDVEGAITQGKTLFEALTNAEIALAEIMVAYENFEAGRGEEMTNMLNKFEKFSAQYERYLDNNAKTTMVKVDTDEYRKNPSDKIELYYSPNTKKYYTVLADDNVEVYPITEQYLRRVSGVA